MNVKSYFSEQLCADICRRLCLIVLLSDIVDLERRIILDPSGILRFPNIRTSMATYAFALEFHRSVYYMYMIEE
jgi:hypothetical protein